MDVILRFFFYMEEMCLWVWRACLFTYTRSLLGCKCKCKYTDTTVFSGNPFPLHSEPPVLYKKVNKIPLTYRANLVLTFSSPALHSHS